MPILFAPIRINNTYYVDGGILMNLPVSPIRKECEKVIALNVDPLVADEYSKNVVSIALRAYHFIFQANTLPQKGIADLLIESYGLEEYSNRELERAEEIFEKRIQYGNGTPGQTTPGEWNNLEINKKK